MTTMTRYRASACEACGNHTVMTASGICHTCVCQTVPGPSRRFELALIYAAGIGIAAVAVLVALTGHVRGLEMGYYCGHSILYPYAAVYCPEDTCLGDCRSGFMFMSKSAPLPEREKACFGYDLNGYPPFKRYEWSPRIQNEDRTFLRDARRVCYWEDRGQPQ